MGLLKDFYTVNSVENEGNGLYSAEISLNKNHDIYKGHFPGNPVTPGVCLMQMVKEIGESILKKKLFFLSANQVKFISFINPVATPHLRLTLEISEGEDIKIKNTAVFGETIALKMSLKYKEIL